MNRRQKPRDIVFWETATRYWLCKCDHLNPLSAQKCAKCGAERGKK